MLQVPSGYEIVKQLSARGDKEIYLIEAVGGSQYIWKTFQKTYKYPLYKSLLTHTHANMPQVYEAVLLEDCFYIIEEYIVGETLHNMLARDGIMSKEKALPIVMQLCDVLTYLHGLPTPIIHRDITPTNIIVAPCGTVKLLDFDIARQYRPDAPKDTEVVGTKPFAPPEQYGFAQSDHRTDIYALGILLTVMLTNAYNPARIADPNLCRIATRCTAFSPNKRYRSVKLLKRQLISPHRRNLLWRGLTFGVVVALVLGGLAMRTADTIYAPQAEESPALPPGLTLPYRVVIGNWTPDENNPGWGRLPFFAIERYHYVWAGMGFGFRSGVQDRYGNHMWYGEFTVSPQYYGDRILCYHHRYAGWTVLYVANVNQSRTLTVTAHCGTSENLTTEIIVNVTARR